MKENLIIFLCVVAFLLTGFGCGIAAHRDVVELRVQECIEMSTTGNLIQWQAEYPYCNVLVHTIDNLGNDVYVPMTIKEYNEYLPSN